MKSTIGRYLITFALGMITMFCIKTCDKPEEEIKVPVSFEIKTPEIKNDFKPIENPKPIIKYKKQVVVDSFLVDKYKKANDSLKQKLYESSVTKRQYKEVFEDSIQSIEVKADVIGTLNSIQASYVIKPRRIKVDTIISIKVPNNNRSITLYGEAGTPLKLPSSLEEAVKSGFILKGGFDVTTNNNWIYGASYDSRETFWLKIGKRFDF